MTEATPLASEQITQEDREAAASNIKRRLVWQHGGEQQWMDASTASMRMGEQDDHDEVQAFARHRIAALSASPAPSGQGVSGEGSAMTLERGHAMQFQALLEGVPPTWRAHGYKTEAEEIADMANVGRALMEALPEGYSYNDCPSEIVADLQNERDEALAAPAPSCAPGEVERLRDAAENLVIAVGMGWDLEGVVSETEAALAALSTQGEWPTDGALYPQGLNAKEGGCSCGCGGDPFICIEADGSDRALSPQGLDAKEGGE